jgi:hypothetical protein
MSTGIKVSSAHAALFALRLNLKIRCSLSPMLQHLVQGASGLYRLIEMALPGWAARIVVAPAGL